ncbi:MAG: NUDIX domain-containing protein [Cyclobacteriaceae bacterium]
MALTTNYSHGYKLLLATDCIIFGFDQDRKLKILLVNRDVEPYKGKWALMGGFVRENENVDAAAERVLQTLTGLSDIYLEQLHAFGNVGRDEDPERVVSITYFALINIHEYDQELTQDFGAKWFAVDEFPDLVFDHNEMVKKAIRKLRLRATTKPIGFKLLPDKFTIPQLKSLYDVILGVDLDKRNFSRRVLSMGILKKLDEKERNTSKKGAFYYQFDEQKYNRLLEEGLHFSIK